jgi:pimeloyl-ACP methyl ester carboxylesterase
VVWGGRDRYLPARFGAAYADRLPNAELLEAPDAGHWPWLDQPELIGRMIRFLVTGEDSPSR